jgi:hypothetical protein
MKGTRRIVSIEVEVPPDFYEMQDWLGQAAEPLEAVAEKAVKEYIRNGYSLYGMRSGS